MNTFVIIIIIIFLIIFIFEINKKEYYKLKRIIKFIMSLPGASLLSSSIDSIKIACKYKETVYVIDATVKKYGKLTRVILGTELYVLLSEPEDYKFVLMDKNGNNKNSPTKLWDIFIGEGIIRASDADHKIRRKILHPLLNLKYLSEYVTFYDVYSNLCADALEKHVDGSIFDLKPYLTRYSFHVFLATTVGIQRKTYSDEDDEILDWQKKLLIEVNNKIIKPWLRINWISALTKSGKELHTAQKNILKFVYNVLQKTTNHTSDDSFQKTKPIFNNYWNRLEELRNVASKSYEISDENFVDDFRSFFAAIQNTISETTFFVIIMLAMHTDVQKKVREEILITFNNDNVDAQRLFSMRYFHMVFKETMRLFPITPMILRQLTGDIKLESCTLPHGCNVMIPIFAIHRNPTYWTKPLEFIPERFSSENLSHFRYTHIPFGTGPRDCLGQRYAFLSVATIIVNLLRRFQFQTTIRNINDIEVSSDIILRGQNIKVSISRV